MLAISEPANPDAHANAVKRHREMAELSDDQRLDAIDASANVVGFERFAHRAKQVQLSVAYRSPVTPAGAA